MPHVVTAMNAVMPIAALQFSPALRPLASSHKALPWDSNGIRSRSWCSGSVPGGLSTAG